MQSTADKWQQNKLSLIGGIKAAWDISKAKSTYSIGEKLTVTRYCTDYGQLRFGL